MSPGSVNDVEYLVVVQCDIVMERCSGYYCERAYQERSGGFSIYSPERSYRTLYLTCGGCCGRALHRKLSNLVRRVDQSEGISKERIAVQLASCVTKDNYHGPPCPHLAYLETLISRLGLKYYQDTVVSERSEDRRRDGRYVEREGRAGA